MHATLIANGYKAIGEKAPNYGSLSRKECQNAIDKYEKKMASSKITTSDALKLNEELVHGLKNLEVEHIPLNWI